MFVEGPYGLVPIHSLWEGFDAHGHGQSAEGATYQNLQFDPWLLYCFLVLYMDCNDCYGGNVGCIPDHDDHKLAGVRSRVLV